MSLKVFDLQCELNHVFEGWFSSLHSYESQQAQGLLTCPVCNSSRIIKKLSAPRLNMGRAKESSKDSAAHIGLAEGRQGNQGTQESHAVAAPATEQLAQLQAKVMQHIRQIVRNTEDVGARFADEARSMHEGEVPERAIRGTATAQERESLAQDGIAVLPIPDYLDDDRLQ